MTARREAGEGAVFQRADGCWVGRVELGRSPTGRRLRGQVVRKTKLSVLNGLKELQRQAEMGVAPDKTRTVMQYLDWWLENVAPETVSTDTLADYRWQYARAILRRALSWAEGTGGILIRNVAALGDGPKKGESKLDDSPRPIVRTAAWVPPASYHASILAATSSGPVRLMTTYSSPKLSTGLAC